MIKKENDEQQIVGAKKGSEENVYKILDMFEKMKNIEE